MQVLVVEDECLIRMLVCNLLEEAGYVCIEATNAIEALALLDSKLCRPALLVTDFNLGPGPNGQTLAREVVSRLPAQESPHSEAQIGPNIWVKTGCCWSREEKRARRGRSLCSGMVGMSSITRQPAA